MSNSTVTETKLVITQKGKDSGNWTWLHNGGWAKGLTNPCQDRFASSSNIESLGLRASKSDLDKAVSTGLFEIKTVNTVYSCM